MSFEPPRHLRVISAPLREPAIRYPDLPVFISKREFNFEVQRGYLFTRHPWRLRLGA